MYKKRFIIFLSVFLFIYFVLSSFNKVNASGIALYSSVTTDEACYNYLYKKELDTELNAYRYEYRCYGLGGMHEGEFYLRTNIIDNYKFFVYCNSNGSLTLYVNSRGGFEIFNKDNNDWLLRNTTADNRFYGWVYTYNADSKNFEITNNHASGGYVTLSNIANVPCPDSIILSNTDVLYYCNANDNNTSYSYSYLMNGSVLHTPQLKYRVGEGFRLYLQDFHDDIIIYDDLYRINRTLSTLKIYLYNLNSGVYVLSGVDALSASSVKLDTNENYYIDFPFAEFFPSITAMDGDYVVGFVSIVTDLKRYREDITLKTLYNDASYFRFRYYASSGTGILVPSDESR